MISVIVPVYNSQDYLHICLNSILKQTYQDFEIICIDDNSSDSSLEILDFFSKKDSRIKIIKNNYRKGLSNSLNKGLDISKGKFILFLDSRNWLSFDSLELINRNIEKSSSDVVLFKNIIFDNDNQIFSAENDDCFNGLNETFNHFDLDKEIIFMFSQRLYNGFYSKSFLKKHNIRFPYEDDFAQGVFFYKTILAANKISFVDKYLFNCRTSSKLNVELNELIYRYNVFKVFLENKKIYEYYKKELFNFLINFIFNKKLTNKLKYEYLRDMRLIFEELILRYGLYEDIKENIDSNILKQFKFEDIMPELEKSHPKLSVIIPIFNVEMYLDRCLNSVCSQSFKNIEIICVNDGSTDDSYRILKNFAKNDLRITIINQENHGLGNARNVGLNNSNGDYILFIDSDDYIELDALEYIYHNLISNDSDLAIFKFSRFDEENINFSQTGFPLEDLFGDINYSRFTFNYNDIKKHVLNSSFSAWSKVYKKEFLDKFNFSFLEGIAYEDVLFHVQVLLNASSISYIPKFLYNYRISNSTSIMSDNSNIWDIFDVSNHVENYLKTSNHFDEFKLEFLMFKITQLSQYLKNSNSKKYFSAVKSEFECLINKGEINREYFMDLSFKNKGIFFTLLNSKNYNEFLKNLDKD